MAHHDQSQRLSHANHLTAEM